MDVITKRLSEQIAFDKPVTFEEVMSYDFEDKLRQIDMQIDIVTAMRLSDMLKYQINLYRNVDTYFVSFSRKNDDP